MPDNPLVIIFLTSIILIAIYMAIEGLVFVYNFGMRYAGKLCTPAPPPAPDVPDDAPIVPATSPEVAGNVLAVLASAKPHLLVVGHTGGGKSVLVRAFTKHLADSGTSVVALDPDAASHHYPVPVHLINDDEQWSAAIASVADLFSKRNEEFRAGTERFEPIWVIADECQELLALDGVLDTIERVIRRGRKLNMHVLLAVQDSQVKTLGLERKSSLLVNLSRVEVMRRGNTRVATVDEVEYTVPDLPTQYDGACGVVIDFGAPAPAPVTKQWTDKHIQAASILAAEPDVSGRELARQLYGGNGSGDAYYLARNIREEINETNLELLRR
jgi:energy-coupling factor transporter ATP-binding protein EcfA2